MDLYIRSIYKKYILLLISYIIFLEIHVQGNFLLTILFGSHHLPKDEVNIVPTQEKEEDAYF